MLLKVFILPFQKGDQLREFAWKAPEPGVAESLDLAFREFNVVFAGDSHVARGCRSMSVGDVIEADGRLWECAPAGWTEIEAVHFERLKGMTFEERNVRLLVAR